MAHFARINAQGIVERVIVAEQDFIDALPDSSSWVQTSYNTYGGEHRLGGVPFRKNYAVIGGRYDPILDAFMAPKPYPSWVLNEETCLWEAPTTRPTDGKVYSWNEQTLNWVEQ
jgi:hypothetical protein